MNIAHCSLLALAAAGTACFFTACDSNPAAIGDDENPPVTPVQNYLSSYSMGDFAVIAMDASARTFDYNNITRSQQSVLTFRLGTVTGSYNVVNPQGPLVETCATADAALIGTSTDNNPTSGTPSLVTALPGISITKDTLRNGVFNMLHFRTNVGGFEAGWLRVQPGADITYQTYSPYRFQHVAAPFLLQQTETYAGWRSRDISSALNGKALTMLFNQADSSLGNCYVYQSPIGMLTVANREGSLICAPQAIDKYFDATKRGDYNGVVYQKTGGSTNLGTLVESGTTTVSRCTVSISGTGHIRVKNAAGKTLCNDDFTPFSDDVLLYKEDSLASGLLKFPCYGMFSYRGTVKSPTKIDTNTRNLFVTFSGPMVLFGCYDYVTDAPEAGAGLSKPYTYFYGTALWDTAENAEAVGN